MYRFFLLINFCTAGFLTKKYIRELNSKQTFWRAGKNSLKHIPLSGGTENACRSEKKFNGQRMINRANDSEKIPPQFHVQNFSFCNITLRRVPSQGNCANSWAVATAAAISDRLCIASRQQDSEGDISAEDLTTCCSKCIRGKSGCHKGSVREALEYFSKNGIVTGDYFGSSAGCKPYSKTLYTFLDKPHIKGKKLSCIDRCTNEVHDHGYKDDKVFGVNRYLFPRRGVEAIQRDIMKFGPVIAAFKIHKDFYAYRQGIYVPQSTENSSWHTVNLLGWGEKDGVQYWVARNSWGPKWGMGGFFHIRKGENDGLIESYVYGVNFKENVRSFNKYYEHEMSSAAKLSSSVIIFLNFALLT